LALPLGALAQLTKPGQANCLSPDKLSTAEQKLCLIEQMADAEKKVAALLHELVTRSDAEERSALRAAHKAWEAYRDADCDAFARMAGFSPMGSGFGVQVGMCMQSMYADRAKELAVQLRMLGERTGKR
jgi:uncharacterized protein YecT (DUF1311 family)